MLFSRKYKVRSNSRLTDVKHRLLGKHTTVHNFDFEIYEDEDLLHIVPNREHRDDDGKTLPDEREQPVPTSAAGRLRAKDAEDEYNRHDREVFEQQHRESRFANGRGRSGNGENTRG